MAHKQVNHKDQKLSKDMKKQSHVSSKKPNNSTLSSEDHLAEKPKKGSHREPNSKNIDEPLGVELKFRLTVCVANVSGEYDPL